MRRYVQYEPFDIYCFEASDWQHPVHKHTYFEIIFIREGSGKHILNNNTVPYSGGDVFLLGPEDFHYFDITEKSCFIYIRFTETYIKDLSQQKHQAWQALMEALLTANYQAGGSIVKEAADKKMLEHLLAVLLHEYSHRHKGSYETIMDSLMKALLSMLARHIIQQAAPVNGKIKAPQLVEALLVHIRQNICQPEALRIEAMAQKFHYSPGYLSTFFKKEVGESLQQYILKYKLKQVEMRLQNSSLTISEIGYEYGFADESHLNKTFRKYYGQAPGAFRKNVHV